MTTGILVAVALVLASQADADSSSQSTFLTAVAGSYDENRAKFAHGVVKFDYLDGFAENSESARRGELSDACAAACVYVFNVEGRHPQYRYSREFTEKDSAAQTRRISDSQSSSRLDSFRALSNGALTLFDQITWVQSRGMNHAAEILPGSEKLFQVAEFPFELGFPEAHLRDMAHQIRSALKGEEGASVGSVEQELNIDVRALARFTLIFPHGEAVYLIAPEFGWVPIEKHSHVKNGPDIDYYYDDVRLVQGRGWLPFVRTVYSDNCVHRIVVREAEFEAIPKPAEFDMEFVEPRTMVNAAAGLWYRNPKKTWNLSSLPSASSSKTQKIKISHEPSPSALSAAELPGEREPRAWHLGLVAIGALGFTMLVLAVWVRRRKSI